MATVSPNWLYPDRGLRSFIYANGSANNLFMKIPFAGKTGHSLTGPYRNKSSSNARIRCEKSNKKESSHEEVSIERAPYYSYMDSTSGQYEPASGARASIPSQEYWPEGTASQVKAARAPEPGGVSTGAPSFGKKPGSRRGKNRVSVASSLSSEESMALVDDVEVENSDDGSDGSREFLENEYVVYENGKEREEMSEYEMDKREGRPHPFIDPEKKKPIKETLSSEELWWNWRKPEKEQWSRWQRRRPDVETVFLKAMAETGQVKIYGETPTLTETALYRARRKIYKEERLQAEQERLQEIGPLAYYSEWVKAWKRDTSREAIQKHFEETGEDENTQLMEMFSYQTDKEYRTMMGTDVRIKRDPLAMRMREDQIKQIWGGDPVYPTVNYIQDPDEVIDFRGADFHEPTPSMLDYLKEHRKVITREELENILSKEKTEQIEVSDIDEAMARAVDIGETDDEEAESETEDSNEEEKITRDWSNVKSMPHLQKKKEKPKKDKLSLDEAVDDSENLTDFLLDFDEEE